MVGAIGAAGFLIAFFTLCLGVGHSISVNDIFIPNLSKIKPFSSEANLMSLEGYVVSYCKINYGQKISKSEARRIIKRSLKTVSCRTEEKRPIESLLKSRINKTVKFDPRKIVLLPFTDKTGLKTESVDLVNYFTQKLFTGRGYKVISLFNSTGKGAVSSSVDDPAAAARLYGAEYVITGSIDHYQKYKRFRLAGFLFDYAFTSVHGYADIAISSNIYSASKNAFVFQDSSYAHKKHQWFALFHGTETIMSYAANDAVRGLFEKFLDKCKTPEKREVSR